MNPSIPHIQSSLREIDKTLYIVGGYCRDRVLDGQSDGDIDLVTDATPDQMRQALKVVGEVGKKYGTCIVQEGRETYELTTFRKDIGSVNHRKPAQVHGRRATELALPDLSRTSENFSGQSWSK